SGAARSHGFIHLAVNIPADAGSDDRVAGTSSVPAITAAAAVQTGSEIARALAIQDDSAASLNCHIGVDRDRSRPERRSPRDPAIRADQQISQRNLRA